MRIATREELTSVPHDAHADEMRSHCLNARAFSESNTLQYQQVRGRRVAAPQQIPRTVAVEPDHTSGVRSRLPLSAALEKRPHRGVFSQRQRFLQRGVRLSGARVAE
jgi:hypothetical protein